LRDVISTTDLASPEESSIDFHFPIIDWAKHTLMVKKPTQAYLKIAETINQNK
jgi:hypothetical protein